MPNNHNSLRRVTREEVDELLAKADNPRAMRRVVVKFHRDYFPPTPEHAMAVSGPLYRAGETYALPNGAAIALSGYCERVYGKREEQ